MVDTCLALAIAAETDSSCLSLHPGHGRGAAGTAIHLLVDMQIMLALMHILLGPQPVAACASLQVHS